MLSLRLGAEPALTSSITVGLRHRRLAGRHACDKHQTVGMASTPPPVLETLVTCVVMPYPAARSFWK